MWFKVFVLLRMPISVGWLLGYAMALKAWNKLNPVALSRSKKKSRAFGPGFAVVAFRLRFSRQPCGKRRLLQP